MEKNYINLVNFETKNNQLEIVNFEAVKNQIEQGLDKEYKVFVIQTSEDYKSAKATRAELNKISKEINDNKIQWVNDLTLKVKEQTKAICELINSKSKEFDKNIKDYEDALNAELGNKKKESIKYELILKFTNRDELYAFIGKIPKKIHYTVKEKGVKQGEK